MCCSVLMLTRCALAFLLFAYLVGRGSALEFPHYLHYTLVTRLSNSVGRIFCCTCRSTRSPCNSTCGTCQVRWTLTDAPLFASVLLLLLLFGLCVDQGGSSISSTGPAIDATMGRGRAMSSSPHSGCRSRMMYRQPRQHAQCAAVSYWPVWQRLEVFRAIVNGTGGRNVRGTMYAWWCGC